MVFSRWKLLFAAILCAAAAKISRGPTGDGKNWKIIRVMCSEQGIMGPVFIYEPPNYVDFSNSTGQSIECSAHGNPSPTVQWVLADFSPVTNISRLRRVLPNATLVFPSFRAEDYRPEIHSSVYRCVASNPLGTIISRDVHVRAVVLQVYDAQVYDEYVIRGNTAVLKCQIPSFVADYVAVTSWVRDAVVSIEKNSKTDGKFVVLPSGELYIHDVSPGDGSHSYHCRTVHLLTGAQRLSATAGKIVVTDPNGSVPPRVTDSKSTIQARERESIVLPCAAQGHPMPAYSWYFKTDTGQLVSVQTTTKFRKVGGTLLIDRLETSDAGTYVCVAANSLGSEKVETTLIVTVPMSVHIEPPQQVLDRGKSAIFTCVISGSPVNSIVWKKNGRLLQSDPTTHAQREILRITSVQRENAGMYQCFVSNNAETVQSTAELRLGDSSPEMVHSFREETMRPGASLSLKCVAAGNPPPKVNWSLDDQPVNSGDRIRVGDYVDAAGNVVSHVNISRVQVEDGGLFQCSARNKAGAVSYVARIIVLGNPFIRPLPKITTVAGDDMQIRCPVSGYPIDVILWEKDGSRLPVNHRQKVFPNGTIHVQNVQRMPDAGKYTCVARNKQGQSARRDFEVQVLVPPKIIPFSFQDDQTYEGVRASVFCSLSQGDLPLFIRWYKDDREIQANLEVSTQVIDKYASTLVIEKVTSHHGGNYTCSARNAAATVNHTAQLTVNVPPRWKVEPMDSSVLLSSSVEIDCQADGHPKPVVTWLKAVDVSSGDFEDITPSSRLIISDEGSLKISHAEEKDESYYMCKATNNVGTGLSKVIFLNVKVPAEFETKLRNHTIKRGEEAQLSCVAKGDTPIQITWSVNRQELPLNVDKRYSVKHFPSESGMKSYLYITEADRKDNVPFKCFAKNPYGQDDATINVIVQELPEAPKDIRLTEQGSRSVQIAWRKPYDGNTPVTGYIIQYIPTSEDWSPSSNNVTVSSAEPRLSIANLRPATAYRFRVFAMNDLGLSDPSAIVTMTTGEEAPSGPPRDVRVEAMDSQTLRVTWKPPKQELWNGELRGYHVGFKLYNFSEPYAFRTVQETPSSSIPLAVRLEKLKKFTKYSIVVQAYNDHGIGPNSDEVVAITSEDVPTIPPENVKCSAVSTQSLHVVWDQVPPHELNGVLQGYKVVYRPAEEWYGSHDGFETKITPALKTMLHGLEKFTNYSVQVLAFTRVGDGVKSESVFCSTLEDAPNPPADIKALAKSLDSIMVSWKKPVTPNGVIQKYTVYMRSVENGREETTKTSVSGGALHYEAKSLSKNRRYEFWVTASTAVGEGQSTRVAAQSTSGPMVAAKIASFGERIVTSWKKTIKMTCLAVGTPSPDHKWTLTGTPVQPSDQITITADGTLIVKNVQNSDNGNYTCSVQNSMGSDSVTYQLIVEVPPSPPVLSIVTSTMRSLELRWTTPKDGSTPTRGYILNYRQDYGQWIEVKLHPDTDKYVLDGLACGTRYQMYITAFNRIGTGAPSEIISAKTKGEAPEIPSKEKLIVENSTFITLHLNSFFDGGCPILYFVVEYKRKDGAEWTLVSNNVKPEHERFVITDLAPGGAYRLKVTAHSSAGSDTAEYDFFTLRYMGDDPVKDEAHANGDGALFSVFDPSVVIPTLTSLFLVVALVTVVCVCLGKKRRNRRSSNDKLNTRYQSVSPSVTSEKPAGGIFAPLQTNTAPRIERLENGTLKNPRLPDNVNPYATFQIVKSSQDPVTVTGDMHSYSPSAPELNYNVRYPSLEDLYSKADMQTVQMCPRHQMTHPETEVPDLLDHGMESSSSGEVSPQTYQRPFRPSSLARHRGNPAQPADFTRMVKRQRYPNHRQSTAETTFIFSRRQDETCSHRDVPEYSEADGDREDLYRHKDSNINKTATLY